MDMLTISQYGTSNLFDVAKYTWILKNIILNYTMMTHSMSFVQSKYNGKK